MPLAAAAFASGAAFANKRVILFSLPGAFTPTCSTFQLPDFNKLYDDFKEFGIDEIYCISVNDSFVMNAWAKHHDIGKVKVIPDGSGEFTRKMGMLVKKDNLGFGLRSWRYAVIIENNEIIIPDFIDTIFYNEKKMSLKNNLVAQSKFSFLDIVINNNQEIDFNKDILIEPIYISNNKILN